MKDIEDKIRRQPWFAQRVRRRAERLAKEAGGTATPEAFLERAENSQLCVESNIFLRESLLHYSLLHKDSCDCFKFGTCPVCDRAADEILEKYENFPN